LMRRQAKVSVGKIGDQEIDFVAEFPDNRRVYVQVCYLLSDADVVEREFGVLELIPDNYPKWVLSLDPVRREGRNGILWFHLADWLLQEEWSL
ncbi:MAG TPA: hypothetical protein VLM37_10225, partial [Fibrobacteraceae bacterium]|nr:hypothetical protein [Fibrobacteraceae bacterium]